MTQYYYLPILMQFLMSLVTFYNLIQDHWKIIIPKMGVKYHHISGWGNDPHETKGTPRDYRIETEPHHHHYDPNDRRKRKL